MSEEVVIGSIMNVCLLKPNNFLKTFNQNSVNKIDFLNSPCLQRAFFLPQKLHTFSPSEDYTFFLLQKWLCVSRINVTNALSSLRSHCEQTSAQKQVSFPTFTLAPFSLSLTERYKVKELFSIST